MRSPQLSSHVPNGTSITQQNKADESEHENQEGKAQVSAPLSSESLGEGSISSSGSDSLLEQLLRSNAVPIETFSSLIDCEQPSGFSYLDPDFDIGIPSMMPEARYQHPEIGSAEAHTASRQEDNQQRPFSAMTQLKTCSDDDDCEVRRQLHFRHTLVS